MEPAFSGAYFFLLLSDFSHLERWLTSFTLVRCEEDRVEKLHFFFFLIAKRQKGRERRDVNASMMITMMTIRIIMMRM